MSGDLAFVGAAADEYRDAIYGWVAEDFTESLAGLLVHLIGGHVDLGQDDEEGDFHYQA